MKRISTAAYQALREALAVIVWNKRPFETYLRTALRDQPELLARLPFGQTKREVADCLVDTLASAEAKYQETTVTLMLEVASLTKFPNVESIKDADDRAYWLDRARTAVAQLQEITQEYTAERSHRERANAEREARRAQNEALQRFDDDIEALRVRFVDLHSVDPHPRGPSFERLLTDLFELFDMEPRLSYRLEREQIDGSLTFDTDDYIVEARWRREPTAREDVDVFDQKVRRKGKNALGLFVSVNGFTGPALDAYSESTSFFAVDGADLYLVLERRVRLDDLLRAKKRHANETGHCHLPAQALL